MTILKKIKNRFNRLFIKKTFKIRPQIEISKKWYGTEYGGFYINEKLLKKNSIIYSFGIGEDISFDQQIINEINCKIYAFDPTPKSIAFLKKQPNSDKLVFTPIGLDAEDGDVTFLLPKNKEHVSGSKISMDHVNANESIVVKMECLSTIMSRFGHTEIDLLKMDIEGSEYSVLENILDLGIKINQFAIEFHYRMIPHGVSLTKEIIRRLNKAGYLIFAASKSMEEISFIHSSVLPIVKP